LKKACKAYENKLKIACKNCHKLIFSQVYKASENCYNLLADVFKSSPITLNFS